MCLSTQCAGELSLKGFLGQDFDTFCSLGGPIWAQFEDLGGALEHSKTDKFAKIGNCAYRGDQEGAKEPPWRLPESISEFFGMTFWT